MRLRRVQDLHVFALARGVALRVHELSRLWPPEERFHLTSQARRSARAVCANLAEAWGKRLYPRHFVSKLTDALAENDELGVWLDFAHHHGYLEEADYAGIEGDRRQIATGIVRMIRHPEHWSPASPRRGC